MPERKSGQRVVAIHLNSENSTWDTAMLTVLFDLDDTLMDHSGAVRVGAGEFYRRFEERLGGGGVEGELVPSSAAG